MLPLYDYHCSQCDETHEVRHSAEDGSPQPCPNCSSTMRKRFTAPPLRFKGEDFTKKARV